MPSSPSVARTAAIAVAVLSLLVALWGPVSAAVGAQLAAGSAADSALAIAVVATPGILRALQVLAAVLLVRGSRIAVDHGGRDSRDGRDSRARVAALVVLGLVLLQGLTGSTTATVQQLLFALAVDGLAAAPSATSVAALGMIAQGLIALAIVVLAIIIAVVPRHASEGGPAGLRLPGTPGGLSLTLLIVLALAVLCAPLQQLLRSMAVPASGDGAALLLPLPQLAEALLLAVAVALATLLITRCERTALALSWSVLAIVLLVPLTSVISYAAQILAYSGSSLVAVEHLSAVVGAALTLHIAGLVIATVLTVMLLVTLLRPRRSIPQSAPATSDPSTGEPGTPRSG